jgi:transposase InsO family protein
MEYPVEVCCKVLQVSRSGYYKWLRRQQLCTERMLHNAVLVKRVREIFDYHKQRYGAKRVRKELLKEGQNVSIKRVNRIMTENGLVCLHTRRFKVVTTDSKHKLPVADNRLDRDFSAPAPNQVWVTDITYIKVATGWVYLAVILDLFNRKVVSYHTSTKINAELVIGALDKALVRCKPSKGLLFHSDRGVQFASSDFRQAIAKAYFVQSMSRKGNCWDNAVMESFFATLKKELIYQLGECTQFQIERELFEYIEAYYNTVRSHSALGYLSPLEFERLKLAD